MDQYIFTLEEVEIPISSFSFRHLSGEKSRLRVVVPTFRWAGAIADRSHGDMSVKWFRNSRFVQEVAQVHFDGLSIPNAGSRQSSITLSGTRQTTVTPPSEPIEIPKDYVSYRSPNQTDGRWTYRLAVPIEGAIPTCRVTIGTHTFVVKEMQWQVSEKQFVLYIKE